MLADDFLQFRYVGSTKAVDLSLVLEEHESRHLRDSELRCNVVLALIYVDLKCEEAVETVKNFIIA